MNLTTAIVRSTGAGEAVVEVEMTGCGRCDEPGGCGGAAKADLFCHGRTYRVLDPIGTRVGERVKVAISEGAISASATRAYLVPLCFLLIGAALGRLLGDSSTGEVMVIGGAAAGLAAGWLWLRLGGPAAATITQPTIVSRT